MRTVCRVLVQGFSSAEYEFDVLMVWVSFGARVFECGFGAAPNCVDKNTTVWRGNFLVVVSAFGSGAELQV